MKKRIGLGIIAASIIAGAFVFANNEKKETSNICPDRPGCICTDQTNEQATKSLAVANAADICPNKAGCICK